MLLDKIQNKENHAVFEILGILNSKDKNEIIAKLLSNAKNLLPQGRAGIEITLHHLFPSRNDFVERNDLVPYYDLFEMTNSGPSDWYVDKEIIEVVPEDEAELYLILVNPFRENEAPKAIRKHCKRSGAIPIHWIPRTRFVLLSQNLHLAEDDKNRRNAPKVFERTLREKSFDPHLFSPHLLPQSDLDPQILSYLSNLCRGL